MKNFVSSLELVPEDYIERRPFYDRFTSLRFTTRSMLISKKHYIGIQLDGKVVIKGMEGKKRDRPPFFNQVFSQLIDDYRNEADLSLNILNAVKQLEVAEVDPSLLAYSVVLNKDPEEYQSYTPQHKIGYR